MKARPDALPGRLKTAANGVGVRYFVSPDNVVGTLKDAFPMINAELDSVDYRRIVIPTSWHDNSISGLRDQAIYGDADSMVRSMRFAFEWTASINWRAIDEAECLITATNGFLLPDEALDVGRHLILGNANDDNGKGALHDDIANSSFF
jgi:hypothetical protein